MLLGLGVIQNRATSFTLVQVWPYWAYTYSPDPFQPKPLSDEQNWAGELARCPGFDDDPENYQCRPQPQGWSNCWKCPPKDPSGGGYTAYQAVGTKVHLRQPSLGGKTCRDCMMYPPGLTMKAPGKMWGFAAVQPLCINQGMSVETGLR